MRSFEEISLCIGSNENRGQGLKFETEEWRDTKSLCDINPFFCFRTTGRMTRCRLDHSPKSTILVVIKILQGR